MASFARLPPPPRDFVARSTAQLSKGTVSGAPIKGTVSEAPSKGASEAPSKEASEAPNDVKHREAPNEAGGGGRGGGGGGGSSRGIGQRTRGIRDRGAAGRLIYTLVRRLGECAGKLKGQV